MTSNYDLQNCADLNNRGIEYEKRGDVDHAISVYEENISMGYAATHSYDRLMIIYRKRKDYGNEIRVISKAIKVFSEENLRRAEKAEKDNPNKASEIMLSLETCKPVYGSMRSFTGSLLICFSPYDVNKYKKRLAKAQLLKQKQEKERL